jgi:hypothetical protein
MTDDVDVAGFNAAEKYAKLILKQEKQIKVYNTSGIPLHKLPKNTIGRLREAAGLPTKIPSPPPEAIEHLKYGRFDPEKNRKAHGGYVKKYANGGSVRKVRR